MEEQNTISEVIKAYQLGNTTFRKLAQRYGYSSSTIFKWVMKEKKRQEAVRKVPGFEIQKKEKMPSTIAELREQLYLSQIRIQLLEATIDIADEQLGTNIRKKSGPRQS